MRLNPNSTATTGHVTNGHAVAPYMPASSPATASEGRNDTPPRVPPVSAPPVPPPPRRPLPRPAYMANVQPPTASMNAANWREWNRFMLASGRLSVWQESFCLSVMRRKGVTPKQGKVLWGTLYGIEPRGCGKWGSPG